ncbi:MAG: hypothetical protein GWP91_18150 [Rhodobacterales bacterium]|nr:hypothetical protein [Rhodobacterales bacterium]
MDTSKTVLFVPLPGSLSPEFRTFLARLLAKKFREQSTNPYNTQKEDSDAHK